MVIVQVNEAFEGYLKEGGRVEIVGTQHVGDAAIEAFEPTIGLGPSGLDQAVFDTVIGADPIKGGQTPVGWRDQWRRTGTCVGPRPASVANS